MLYLVLLHNQFNLGILEWEERLSIEKLQN